MNRTAVISDCGRYRYELTRDWDRELGDRILLLPFLMLNPSTADASLDDPTIRRCMTFARRERYCGITVMNLFAFRSPSPAEMKAANDPVGPENDKYLDRLFNSARLVGAPVVAAWGTHGAHLGRDKAVIAMAQKWKVPLLCLGKSKDGHPKHPLYIKSDQPFEALA